MAGAGAYGLGSLCVDFGWATAAGWGHGHDLALSVLACYVPALFDYLVKQKK
jgi:hypothetical protein